MPFICFIRGAAGIGLALVGSGLLPAGPVTAATPITLIGPDLEPRQVHLQALGNGRIAYFGEDRVLKRDTLNQWVSLRFAPREKTPDTDEADGPGNPDPAGEANAAADATDATANDPDEASPNRADQADPVADGESTEDDGVPTAGDETDDADEIAKANAEGDDSQPRPEQSALLARIDGQRLPGTFIGGGKDGQAVRWNHPRFGETNVPLDALAGFARPGAALPPRGDDDIVMLTNGDRLTGFIEAIHAEALTIETEGADEAVPLPLNRIKAVRLANEAEPWPANMQTLVLANGARLAIRNVTFSDGALRGGVPWLGGEPRSFEIRAVRRLDLTAGPWRIIDLTRQPYKVTAGGEVFGLAMPPRREGQSLRLHAPITVRFDLPENARRFAADITLAPDAADEAVARWADCTLSLTAAGSESSQVHLKGLEQRRRRVNRPLTGSPKTLTLQVNGGVNGPVLDRVRLRRPRVLVHQ